MRVMLSAIVAIALTTLVGTATPAPAPKHSETSRGSAPIQLQAAPSFTDVETTAFIVLSNTANEAQQDLRAIMAGVRAINQAKAQLRQNLSAARKLPPSPCAGAAA